MDDFQDIEACLVLWLPTLSLVDHAGNRTPSDLEAKVVFARVIKLGGTDDWITDNPTVDVDVFALSRNAARNAAEQIRTSLRPRVRVGSAIIDSVRTSTSPRELPWSNEKIKRYSATYALGLRR
jgi:hypothetical protein